jgi:hypothetical protein
MLQLEGYEHLVFHGFQLLDDSEGYWEKLARRLQGRPVPNLDRELLEERYQPLWQVFTGLLDPGRLHALAGGLTAAPLTAPVKAMIGQLCEELHGFVEALSSAQGSKNSLPSAGRLDRQLEVLAAWLGSLSTSRLPDKLLVEAWFGTRRLTGLGPAMLGWLLLHNLGELLGCPDDDVTLEYFRRYGLDYAWQESITSDDQARDVLLITLLMRTSSLSPHPAFSEATFTKLCDDSTSAGLLGINSHAGVTWFNKEGMAALAGAIALQAAIMREEQSGTLAVDAPAKRGVADTLRQRLARAAAVGYRLDKFLGLG